MKKIFLILTLGVVIMSESLTIKCDRETIWDNEPKNQIGTDQDFLEKFPNYTPLRTVTSHNNSNSVYVAPNGSDGGTGTDVDPYLTLQYAVDNLGGKSIVTVIRNGYVGDMIFEENVIINDSITLQVEAGETAEMRFDNNFTLNLISTQTIDIFYWIEDKNKLLGGYATGVGINLVISDDFGETWYSPNSAPVGMYNVSGITRIGDRLFCCNAQASGKVYYSDDWGDNWTQTGISSDFYRGISQSNNTLVVVGDNGIKYSADLGGSWITAISTTFWHAICKGENNIIALRDKPYYSNDDGKTWFPTNSVPSSNYGVSVFYDEISKTFLYSDWQSSAGGSIFYSKDDGINWSVSLIDVSYKYWSSFTRISNRIYTGYFNNSGGAAGYVYYSDDNGLSFKKFDTTQKYWIGFINAGGRVLASTTVPNQIYRINYTNLTLNNTNTTINGFKINGINNNNINISIAYNTGVNIIYNNIYNNIYYYAINCGDSTIITNNIISNCKYGIICETPDIQECLFYDIDYNCIEVSGNDFTFNHNTIHSCKIGLLINDSISTYVLKNSIFNECSSYAITSLITQLTITNSVINSPVFNIIIDSDTCQQYNPLFVSEITDDYRIKNKKQSINGSYPIFNSPAYGLSDTVIV